jgi:hypothetical protein
MLWHITSTDIHEASFPLQLGVSRRFVMPLPMDSTTTTFRDIRGGLACQALKEKIKGHRRRRRLDFAVHLTKPLTGSAATTRNIVNWLTAGGRHGIQSSENGTSEKYALTIAEGVAKVYDSELGLPDERTISKSGGDKTRCRSGHTLSTGCRRGSADQRGALSHLR